VTSGLESDIALTRSGHNTYVEAKIVPLVISELLLLDLYLGI